MDCPTRPARPLRALELRYVLTLYLYECGLLTVRQMVEAMEAEGFSVGGRPSKTVSDALRWEVRRGRVMRVGRGRYAHQAMPRQTRDRIRRRVESIHDELSIQRWQYEV